MNTDTTHFWDFGSIPMIEPELLSNILATSSDIAIMINIEGIIQSILINNSNHSFGSLHHWQGNSIHTYLTIESSPKLDKAITDLTAGKTVLRSLELNHQDGEKWQFPISYSLHQLGHQNNILLLGRDLRAISETQQELVKAQIAVERSNEERREFDTHFRMLFSTAKEATLLIDVDTGLIRDANKAANSLFNDEIIGTQFDGYVMGKQKINIVEKLCLAAQSKNTADVQLNFLERGAETTIYPVVYRASGQRILMCRFTPNKRKIERDETVIQNLMALYEKGSDAIVFTDTKGSIQFVNNSFLELVNAAHHSDVIHNSLAEYLSRGQIDLIVMLDNVTKSGQMRNYTTNLKTDFGARLAIEISLVHLNQDHHRHVAFIIRDVSRNEKIRVTEQLTQRGDDQAYISDLIGSTSLKDIVAKTADVIEKTCIEKALEMTNNNRAAAAEILGLSRQSLYVKLRKFGMINRDDDSAN